jgi:HSP20 family protein
MSFYFDDFDRLRRNIGSMFDVFERDMMSPAHLHLLVDDVQQPTQRQQQLQAPGNISSSNDKSAAAAQAGNNNNEARVGTRGGSSALSPFSALSNLSNAVQIRCDVVDSKEKLVINAELPGVPKEQIKLSIKDHVLTISGEKSYEHKEEDGEHRVLRSERSYGTATRMLRLPKNADEQNVSAKYDNGVLHIEVGKNAEPQPHEQQIQIV